MDYLALITAYVDRIQNIYDGTWAYTYRQDDRLKQESLTRRIDPSLAFPRQDVLLAIDDQPPSAERLAEHQHRLERRQQRRLRNSARTERERTRENRSQRHNEAADNKENRDEKARFLAMLIPDSIRLVKQEQDLLYLSFRAVEEERKHIFAHLEGLLILDTSKEYIRELQVRISAPFSPYFLTRVEEGYFSVRFALVNGHPMQEALTWRVHGQALVIRDLDADMEVVWKERIKVGADGT